ncbi:RHS repeat-associated core domain-containing protein [Pantoea ananatis]|uniref:RHS repeat-associated core domain-containing protein n=1 Tax=Pantoea ananas TaxID=553 RepID=UPI001B316350
MNNSSAISLLINSVNNGSSLHYNLFCYYEPKVERFMVSGRTRMEGGWNFYQYALNPLSLVNSLGLMIKSIYI